MSLIYNIGILLVEFALKVIALFNSKIHLGVTGRKQTFKILEDIISKDDKTFWFHCASLGEYEQGLPVFEELKKLYPNHKIVISFFSPSGYEIKKKSPIADAVVYIPIDTKRNAKRFLDSVNPDLTVFVKYEIWPNFLNELQKKGKRTILISALFRENQTFFKFYGKHLRKALFAFEHIFTQDEISKNLLLKIKYNKVTVSGDTRFDRVLNQLKQNNSLDFIEKFKNHKLCIVAGSTWPEDEVLLVNYINNSAKDIKYLIAPHNIKEKQIISLKNSIKKPTFLFSEKEEHNLQDYQVFILDTIGLLSKTYSYADIAYVGGAMGQTGLHNTLEAAVFGIPILIGKNYKEFPEAKNLIKGKGMFSSSNQLEFNSKLNTLIEDSSKREMAGTNNLNHIMKNKGAVNQIISYLKNVKKC